MRVLDRGAAARLPASSWQGSPIVITMTGGDADACSRRGRVWRRRRRLRHGGALGNGAPGRLRRRRGRRCGRGRRRGDLRLVRRLRRRRRVLRCGADGNGARLGHRSVVTGAVHADRDDDVGRLRPGRSRGRRRCLARSAVLRARLRLPLGRLSTRIRVLPGVLRRGGIVGGVSGHCCRAGLRDRAVVAGAVDPQRDEDVGRQRVRGVCARRRRLPRGRLLRVCLSRGGARRDGRGPVRDPLSAGRPRRDGKRERKDADARDGTPPACGDAHAKFNLSHSSSFFPN